MTTKDETAHVEVDERMTRDEREGPTTMTTQDMTNERFEGGNAAERHEAEVESLAVAMLRQLHKHQATLTVGYEAMLLVVATSIVHQADNRRDLEHDLKYATDHLVSRTRIMWLAKEDEGDGGTETADARATG